MSETTPNLGLFKYNSVTDGDLAFNITTALNNNWDILDERCGNSRNIGEIVTSTLPLEDAGLHLLDGALISGSGIYSDFVDYIAGLYADDPTASYFAQPTTESEVSWTQPTLTANGTMGGDEFACSASSYPNVYRAFNSTNTENIYSTSTSETIIFYNPNKLKVTSIVWNVYDTNRNPLNYTVQGSNDGSTYTSIITNQTASAGASTTMNLSSNTDFYNYYKIIVNSFNTGQGNLKTLVISATQLIGEDKTAEQVWQEQVATYGVCGKFVYDSINNTVRLPKYSNKIYTKDISSTTPVIGNGISLGLTDGTTNYGLSSVGYANANLYLGPSATGYGADVGSNNGISNVPISKSYGVTTDPTKSGLVAQLSNITTSLEGYYYIVVATTTKTDIQVDIDEITTDLNGKADVDLTNVSNTSGFRKLIAVSDPSIMPSWYKVYSEYDPTTGSYIGKWCEQGGNYQGANVTDHIINLLVNFKDTTYTTFMNINYTTGLQRAAAYKVSTNKTVDHFQIFVADFAPGPVNCDWFACGYIR